LYAGRANKPRKSWLSHKRKPADATDVLPREPVSFFAFVIGAAVSGGWVALLVRTDSTIVRVMGIAALALPLLAIATTHIAKRWPSLPIAAVCGQLLLGVLAGYVAIYQMT
jgi:hypothetical protein